MNNNTSDSRRSNRRPPKLVDRNLDGFFQSTESKGNKERERKDEEHISVRARSKSRTRPVISSRTSSSAPDIYQRPDVFRERRPSALGERRNNAIRPVRSNRQVSEKALLEKNASEQLYKMDESINPSSLIRHMENSGQKRPIISNRASPTVGRNIPAHSYANDQNIPLFKRKPLEDDTIQKSSIDRKESSNESISPSNEGERRPVQPRGERRPIDNSRERRFLDQREIRSDRYSTDPARSEKNSVPQDRTEESSGRRSSVTALRKPSEGKYEPITTRRPSDDCSPIRRPSDPSKYKIEKIQAEDRTENEPVRRMPINLSPRTSPRQSPRIRRPEVVENDLRKKFAELDDLVIPPVKKRFETSKITPISTRSGMANSNQSSPFNRTQKPTSISSDTETEIESDRDKSEENEPEMTEAERRDIENSRQDLKIKEREKREADRKEAEMIQKEREKKSRLDKIEKSRKGSGGAEYTLVSTREADDDLLVSEYICALIQTLKNDSTVSPIPDDFSSYDSYAYWRSEMRCTFQDTLIKLLKLKYLSDPSIPKLANTTNIKFSVVKARDFVLKDGKPRSAYCDIEYGDFSSKMKMELFRTDVIESNFNPIWNQQMAIEVQSPRDQIKLKVYDMRKEQFLGQAILNFDKIVGCCKRKGIFEEWASLGPRGKSKDKYVGGEILVSASIIEDKSNFVENETFDSMMKKLNSFEVENRSLIVVLLRSCVMLDLYTPREGRRSLLSPESVSLLKIWADMLNVSLSFQVIAYLKVLFEKYVAKIVSIVDVKQELETLYSFFRNDLAKNPKDLQECYKVLDQIKEHCSAIVVNYKEIFPKNQPNGHLEDTIMVLRIVHQFPGFKERNPDVPASFRDELKYLMTQSSIRKYQIFKDKTAPEYPELVSSVTESIYELATLVNEEIDQDMKYYKQAFASEMDIVRLTAEIQLKYFALSLEDCDEIIVGDINSSSDLIFELYKTIRKMAVQYSKSVPGLKKFSPEYIEEWFAPFVLRWLQNISKKTLGWVQLAVKNDNFEAGPDSSEGTPTHSSSIIDVFASLYSKLDFVQNLEWSNDVQKAGFQKEFAKTMYSSMEEYCNAISYQEKTNVLTSVTNFTQGLNAETATAAVSNFNVTAFAQNVASNLTEKVNALNAGSVTAFTQNLLKGKDIEPVDIDEEVCTKLRNINFAMTKIKEMYLKMDVQRVLKSNRSRKNYDSQSLVSGTFDITVVFGENIKPVNSNGTSNPYVVLRIPEGTLQPAQELSKRSSKLNLLDPIAPTKTGKDCELFRTGTIKDTVQPTWDEKGSFILPPIQNLEVHVYSKNLVTADELIGTSMIDLGQESRLRKKLFDYQIHDVFCQLEPQGRVLLRLTMEGDSDDLAFWFKKTNETLIRTRDMFLRSLSDKIAPYIFAILSKSIKNNDATPLPSKSYFQAFTAAVTSVVEYSTETADGKPINQKMRENEVDEELEVLINYLEKNFEVLCEKLPPAVSKAVILRLWTSTLTSMVNLLVPQLYGVFIQKPLNIRQSSMLKISVDILRDFFHGDGGEFGIPKAILDSQLLANLKELLKFYHADVVKLKREYERSLYGEEKEYLLRLVRLLSAEDPGGLDSKWVEQQLIKRKDINT